MIFLSKPVEKRALLIAIRRVQRRVGSKFDNLPDLNFAHRDAKELRDRLIAAHGYQRDNITLMMDDKSHPEHLWPTSKRILCQIDKLTRDAPQNCHFFFYFSGHGLDEDGLDRASMRANGRDDEIVPADGKPILDHILHDRLIKPLERVKGSKLFALLDCCHSETLLDLQIGDGPNMYSRVWRIGAGQLLKDLTTGNVNLLKLFKKCREKHHVVPPALKRASTEWRAPPTPKTQKGRQLSVICLSACRDGQLAHDDCERQLTFTKCFLNAIATNPNITWVELRDKLKDCISGIQARYEEAHQQGLISDSSYRRWTQEPRYSTSPHTNLTKRVSF